MKKTAIIYSFNTKKTGKVAERIKEAFNDDQVEMVNAELIDEEIFMSFDQIIMGVATWFDGELPNFWDEFVPALEDLDLSNSARDTLRFNKITHFERLEEKYQHPSGEVRQAALQRQTDSQAGSTQYGDE